MTVGVWTWGDTFGSWPWKPLAVVKNGVEAMNYLCGAGRYRDRARFPFPTVVLLDLNLPGVHGLDVLKWIKEEEPALSKLKVIVLTASDHVRDASEAYRLGANSFFIKPMDQETVREFALLVQKLACVEAPDQAVKDESEFDYSTVT